MIDKATADIERKDRKELYKHDWEGSCAPGQGVYSIPFATFSVGIFVWVQSSDGKRIKKSRVVYRITGPTSNPAIVYRRAEEVCDLMDRSIWSRKTKSEVMKP
jgi:hypothetical protein